MGQEGTGSKRGTKTSWVPLQKCPCQASAGECRVGTGAGAGGSAESLSDTSS